MKDLINCLKQGGLLFCVLCYALVICNLKGYITLIGIFSIMVFVLITIRTKINKEACIIILYSLSYITFSYLNGYSYTISILVLYAIAPFVFYQFGSWLVKNYKNDNLIVMAWLIIIISYCINIHYITLRDFLSTGMLIRPDRSFSFVNDDSNNIAATLVGLPMSIGVLGLPMSIIVRNKLQKIGFLCVFILSLMTILSLLNRTGIVVAILCSVIVIIYGTKNSLIKIITSLIVITLILFILVYVGVINEELINMYKERNENISTMGDRSYRWIEAIGNLFAHPFGWANNGEIYYVHNMWLDIARVSGIIPFGLLVYMTYDSFKKAFRLIKIYNNAASCMMLGLNVCFFTSCFMEPIYGGTHFMLYCMLWGTETSLLKNYLLTK